MNDFECDRIAWNLTNDQYIQYLKRLRVYHLKLTIRLQEKSLRQINTQSVLWIILLAISLITIISSRW